MEISAPAVFLGSRRDPQIRCAWEASVRLLLLPSDWKRSKKLNGLRKRLLSLTS